MWNQLAHLGRCGRCRALARQLENNARVESELPRGAFRVSSALAAGVTRGQLRSRQLVSPFYGARASSTPEDTVARCRAYLPLLRPGSVFSHVTAAILWGMPLPLAIDDALVHVTAPVGVRAPAGRGVRGHSAGLTTFPHVSVGGLPVSGPVATWMQLSTLLDWRDLAAVGDFIVTGRPLENLLPLAEMADLRRAIESAGRTRGARARSRALPAVGVGPYSRPESLSGLLFSMGGLPPALINEQVNDERGSFLALPDRIWPDYRVAYEYEGDSHREKRRYRSDVHRVERLVDHDWTGAGRRAAPAKPGRGGGGRGAGSRLSRASWDGKVRELRHFVPFGR